MNASQIRIKNCHLKRVIIFKINCNLLINPQQKVTKDLIKDLTFVEYCVPTVPIETLDANNYNGIFPDLDFSGFTLSSYIIDDTLHENELENHDSCNKEENITVSLLLNRQSYNPICSIT